MKKGEKFFQDGRKVSWEFIKKDRPYSMAFKGDSLSNDEKKIFEKVFSSEEKAKKANFILGKPYFG